MSAAANWYVAETEEGGIEPRYFASHRLALYRGAFPLKEGWAMRTSIAKSEIELPLAGEGQTVTTVLIRAWLEKDGQLCAEAHKLYPILGQGSLETGETFARMRLLDTLGIPAGPDGSEDPIEAEIKGAETSISSKGAASKIKLVKQGERDEVFARKDKDSEAQAEGQSEPTAKASKQEVAIKALRNQIEARCKRLRKEVPEFSSLEEARKIWKELAKAKGGEE